MIFARRAQIRLTIAIPTYNRPKSLASTISLLIPQLTPECQLLVVDNASDPPVIDGIGPALAELDVCRARIIRNNTNVGANANILRCMELCDSEWLWILSDDDRIWEDAIRTIFETIADHPTCTCLNFAQISEPRSESSIACGRAELLSVIGRDFYTLLFISTSVYRVAAILPSITYGYMQIPSCAPHLAVLLMAVDKTGTVFFSPKITVEYIPARKGTGWSQFWVDRGLPLLLDLPLNSQDRVFLRRALRARNRFKDVFAAYVDVLCYGLRARDLAICAQLYKMFALRRATLSQSPLEWLIIRCLQTTLLAPGVALQGVRVAYRVAARRTLEDRAARVGLSLDEPV